MGKVFASEVPSSAPASWVAVSALQKICYPPEIMSRSLLFISLTSLSRGARIIRLRKYSGGGEEWIRFHGRYLR